MLGPAFAEARARVWTILLWGAGVGLLLGLSTTVVTRSGKPWFTLSLGIVIGVMMICYLAVPARIVGIEATSASKKDKLAATAIAGALGATVSTPPYLLGRLGILMLGSKILLVPGIFVMTLGFTLQAGATGAVRAIKMSAKLAAGRQVGGESAAPVTARAPRR